MKNPTEMWRRQPMYTFQEAARLSGVSTSTVRNWFLGYKRRDETEMPPLFPDGCSEDSMLSYLQLMETVVAARFRNLDNIRYRDVHAAHRNAREILGIQHPFAHANLESLGGHIIARLEGEETGESLQALDSPGLWSLPGLVLEVIHQIEYKDEFAAKWFPLGKDCPIVVDPHISSGVPTVEGRGVTVNTIFKRWRAGLKMDFIARDLSLEVADVETVLQYGDRIAA